MMASRASLSTGFEFSLWEQWAELWNRDVSLNRILKKRFNLNEKMSEGNYFAKYKRNALSHIPHVAVLLSKLLLAKVFLCNDLKMRLCDYRSGKSSTV